MPFWGLGEGGDPVDELGDKPESELERERLFIYLSIFSLPHNHPSYIKLFRGFHPSRILMYPNISRHRVFRITVEGPGHYWSFGA